MTIPSQMVATVAGVGEFVIKCGGPPVVTCLSGARAIEMRYKHKKGLFRVAYVGIEGWHSRTSPGAGGSGLNGTGGDAECASTVPGSSSMHTIECEIRCDMDTWAAALEIVMDPPPQTLVRCIARRWRWTVGDADARCLVCCGRTLACDRPPRTNGVCT